MHRKIISLGLIALGLLAINQSYAYGYYRPWYRPWYRPYWGYPRATVVIAPAPVYGGYAAPTMPYQFPIVNPPGGYLSLKLGVGILDCSGLGLNLDNYTHTGLTAGAELGANVTQNLALELGFMRLPDVNNNNGMLGARSSVMNSQFTDAAIKLSFPVDPTAALFAKLGAAYATTDLTYSTGAPNANYATVPFLGVGVTAQMSSAFGLEVEYEGTAKHGNTIRGVPAMGALTVGLVANF